MKATRKKIGAEYWSKMMARTNRKYASERMKLRNPMRDAKTRQKMRESMKGKTFISRGGNGKFTEQQRMLSEALGLPVEYSIATQPIRGKMESLPTNYKVDIAEPSCKLAIEVDGKTHKLRKWRFLDARKTHALNLLGWTVLRFWNQQVTEDLAGCVQTVTFTILKLKASTATSPTAS
jgi:hypothetical protein